MERANCYLCGKNAPTGAPTTDIPRFQVKEFIHGKFLLIKMENLNESGDRVLVCYQCISEALQKAAQHVEEEGKKSELTVSALMAFQFEPF